MKFYSITHYLPVLDGYDLQDPYSGTFVEGLKALPYKKRVNGDNLPLDALSKKELGTEQLWWVIGLYNDIIDPMELLTGSYLIPKLDDLEKYLLDFVESKRDD